MVDELGFAPFGGRRRHRAAIELVHSARGGRAPGEPDVEAVSVAPGIGAEGETALAREANRKAAGRKHDRLLRTRPGVRHQAASQLDVACRPGEHFRQPVSVEPPAHGARIPGLRLDHGSPERLQPVERVVEPFDDLALKPRIPVRALVPEIVQRAVAPDDAAREQHRAARPVTLFQHRRRGTKLAGASGRAEPGHARARDDQLAPCLATFAGQRHRTGHYVSENVALCSTYSIRTRSGPQRKTAYVFGASTTSSISTPSSSASEMCSSVESTSTARWFSSGRSG